MNRTYVLGGVLAAAVLAAGGLGIGAALSSPAGAATAMPSAAATPSTAGASIGTADLAQGAGLVDGSGRALYLFEADDDTHVHLHGGLRADLAARTDHRPRAGRVRRCADAAARERGAGRWRPPGDLQRPPALHLHGRQEGGGLPGSGHQPVRWPLVLVAPDGTANTSVAAPAPAAAPAPSGSRGAYGY